MSGYGLELYNNLININWDKYAITVAVITGIIALVGSLLIVNSKMKFRLAGVVILFLSIVWFATAIYKIIHPESGIGEIKGVNANIRIKIFFLSIPSMLFMSFTRSNKEKEEAVKEVLDNLKSLTKDFENNTSNEDQFMKWKGTMISLKVLNDDRDPSVPDKLLANASDVFVEYMDRHYKNKDIDEIFEEKDNELNELSPRKISDETLDTKKGSVLQLIASLIFFLIGNLHSYFLFQDSYFLFFGIALGYAYSSVVSIIYYIYTYSTKILKSGYVKNQRILLRILLKVLIIASMMVIGLQITLIIGLLYHPERIVKLLKNTVTSK